MDINVIIDQQENLCEFSESDDDSANDDDIDSDDIDINIYLNELNDDEASEIDEIKEIEEGDSRTNGIDENQASEVHEVRVTLMEVFQFDRSEIFKDALLRIVSVSRDRLTDILKQLNAENEIWYDEENEKVEVVRVYEDEMDCCDYRICKLLINNEIKIHKHETCFLP